VVVAARDADAGAQAGGVSAEVLTGTGRPDGTGEADDPIDVQGDLDRALDLLAEGKHVRLNQPDEVSTLIGKLGKLVRDARDSGGKAPSIDLCQVTVAGTNLFCVGNKGHRRIDMPQLEGTALPGTDADKLERNAKGFVDVSDQFRSALEDAGVTVTSRTRPANRLRATQNEMNAGIVARIAGEIEQGRTDDPIYVTRDGYIIDGHHVWAANVAVDAKDNRLGDVEVPVNEIDMDIGAAIDFARQFAARIGVESASVSVPATGATAT
jgi:hypothetical protein